MTAMAFTESYGANGTLTIAVAGYSATIDGDVVSGGLIEAVKAELLSGILPLGFSAVRTEDRDWLCRDVPKRAA